MKRPILKDKRALLVPMTLQNYRELIPVAVEKGLIRYSPSFIETPEALKAYAEQALQQLDTGHSLPFLIYDRASGKCAGSTRFMAIDQKNKVLEIGATWLGSEFHGSGLNTHVKHLMINFAFGEMGIEKIVFRIDERNIRSRKAVEKLGAILEGILRKDVYLTDGFKRNTCCYSILKEEWIEVTPPRNS